MCRNSSVESRIVRPFSEGPLAIPLFLHTRCPSIPNYAIEQRHHQSGRRHSAASIHTIRNCGKSSVFGLRLEEATGTFPSRASVVDEQLKREGKGSPNTKYRSRSALLQERATKLVSG